MGTAAGIGALGCPFACPLVCPRSWGRPAKRAAAAAAATACALHDTCQPTLHSENSSPRVTPGCRSAWHEVQAQRGLHQDCLEKALSRHERGLYSRELLAARAWACCQRLQRSALPVRPPGSQRTPGTPHLPDPALLSMSRSAISRVLLSS